MGRRIRSNLPVCTELLKSSSDVIKRDFVEEKRKSKQYYDIHSKVLPPLSVNSSVMMYNCITKRWDNRASVLRMISPRCYLVQTLDGVIYKRNRIHLKPVSLSNSTTSIDYSQDNYFLPRRRSKRVLRQPDRFIP